MSLSVVEICAGAGGQALGLDLAGFQHRLAIEIDHHAANTLRHNRPLWDVRVGDVADISVWNPGDFDGVDLLAGGVPCPPFSMAGKQLGAEDERDLFAWAVEAVGMMRPRAVLLENVRGLSMPRFAAYRQRVKDRLLELGYWSDWKLLEAKDFGVPQLRPRFVLVALSHEDAAYFKWPEPRADVLSVGTVLESLMAANGWAGAQDWARRANSIGPTIVGGSKKHGGADLGPTRAKAAWKKLSVDGSGVADSAPSSDMPINFMPKLTIPMVSRIQGWDGNEYAWEFQGRKTSVYRQIGNAFPPPVARAVGESIANALNNVGTPRNLHEIVSGEVVHDPIYRVLVAADSPLSPSAAIKRARVSMSRDEFMGHMNRLRHDFEVEVHGTDKRPTFKLGTFKGFTGQAEHARHSAFSDKSARSRIS
ncbi:DNA (cytosine-5-)-methyltransferase [Specibacter sp. NPDC078709]|uniref:DNA cytosine methyltransferase n=1 Tax=Specibacter sp. NPDC078709 TaxID=3154364 RepID=UPI0034276933